MTPHHFYKEKFQEHASNVIFTDVAQFVRLTNNDRLHLDRDASSEEIKNTVWDCGSSKALGPDGFSFMFLKSYWDVLKVDVEEFVSNFLATGQMPVGANSAFITLTLKVHNPLLITDFRPILQYKILAKLLANRLARVIDKLVSQEQSTFISGRQILDGPHMLSE
ncbi:hypothetical protein Tco_0346965, partial [Tanacetum coccineum]